ncbi:hypothetical protein [Pseudomonas viridiflava]|uniref:hypothetical protein n=1 Tax=Pseudomonas viridiflava TaxID=33069 RepID=UPI000F02A7A4|nr:hypothetical protein [Pseudomonas viridiflava]
MNDLESTTGCVNPTNELIARLFEYQHEGEFITFRIDPEHKEYEMLVAKVFRSIRQSNKSETDEAMKYLQGLIAEMMSANEYFSYSQKAIKNLRHLLVSANHYGFNPIELLAWHLGCPTDEEKLFDQALEWVEADAIKQTFQTLWVEPLILSIDDQSLLSFKMSENVIAWLAQAKNSETFKSLLRKTGTGRETLMAQDLGL